jgi:hypothetical protein
MFCFIFLLGHTVLVTELMARPSSSNTLNTTHLTSKQPDWYLNLDASFIKNVLIEQRNIQLLAAKIWF